MKICVCVKHVPDTAARIKVAGEAGFDDSVKFVLNPFDEYAVEEALRIVEREGGEVVVVSVGKKTAAASIRSAMAMGAHRGILVIADRQFTDSIATARALKAVIESDGTPDLILAGKQSVDSEGMQTHYRLAASMGLPVANEVMQLEFEEGRAVVTCEAGGGERDVLEMPLPCVLGATKGLNEPRYPKLPDILRAKKKPLLEIPWADLGLDQAPAGWQVISLTAVPERGAARMLKGSVREMVETLVQTLQEQEKVL